MIEARIARARPVMAATTVMAASRWTLPPVVMTAEVTRPITAPTTPPVSPTMLAS